MPNITLRVDGKVIRKVRKIAVDRGTTLTAMVREFLVSVATRDEAVRSRTEEELDESFRLLSRDMGRRTWTREELHSRSRGSSGAARR
jgi:hypothetical protein